MAIIQEAYISGECHELKAEANRKFAAGDYDAALSCYLDVLAKLPPRTTTATAADDSEAAEIATSSSLEPVEREKEAEEPTPTAHSSNLETEEQEQVRRFRSVIYANIAATHLRLDQYRDTVKACNQSLLDQPNYVKALYRRAQANEHVGGWSGLSSSLEDYKTLRTLPDLPVSTRAEVEQAIKRLEPKVKDAAEKEKDEMIHKLKGLGDSILGNFGLSTNNFKFTQQPGGGYSMNFVR